MMLNATTSCGGSFHNPLILSYLLSSIDSSVPAVTHMALCQQNTILLQRDHVLCPVSFAHDPATQCVTPCFTSLHDHFSTHTVITFCPTLTQVQLLHDSAIALHHIISLHCLISIHSKSESPVSPDPADNL